MAKRMRTKLREIKEQVMATRHDGIDGQGKWLGARHGARIMFLFVYLRFFNAAALRACATLDPYDAPTPNNSCIRQPRSAAPCDARHPQHSPA